MPVKSYKERAKEMLCISPFSQVDGGAAPPSGDPASLLSPWEPASAEGKAPVPRVGSICQGLPTLPAATPTDVHPCGTGGRV